MLMQILGVALILSSLIGFVLAGFVPKEARPNLPAKEIRWSVVFAFIFLALIVQNISFWAGTVLSWVGSAMLGFQSRTWFERWRSR